MVEACSNEGLNLEEAEEQEEEAEEEPTPAVNNTLQMEWEESLAALSTCRLACQEHVFACIV